MLPREEISISSMQPAREDGRRFPANAYPAAVTAPDVDATAMAAEAALIGVSRRRLRKQVEVNDRRSGLFTGGSFIVTVAGWILLVPPRSVPIAMLAASVAVFVAVGCVEFEIGPGSALATTPVQVVMLFVLPPQLVPVAVVAGLAGAALVGWMRDRERRERPIVLVGSGWQAVGPAAVFALAHVHGPALSDWPVYVVAIVAQFTFDAASSWVRNCYGLGVRTGQLAQAMRFTFVCDLCLAPVGLAAVLAVPNSAGALVFLLPPTALLAMLQADRRRQLDTTIALGAAFTDTSDLARRDALAGVANRLAWEEVTAHYELSDAPVGVILADVDGLKTANDNHGHALGDRLLVAVTRIILSAVPAESGAIVFRIGGDEFAVLLPSATPAATETVAQTIQTAFRDAPALDQLIPVSASVGLGFAPNGATFGQAVATADRGVNHEKDRNGLRRH